MGVLSFWRHLLASVRCPVGFSLVLRTSDAVRGLLATGAERSNGHKNETT